MKATELLLWLSARREGSWRQYRAAVEELHSSDSDLDSDDVVVEGEHFPLHQKLRVNYERLAHVEFFTIGCKDGWRVTPPTLALHPVPSGLRAVLCGARSPALCERLQYATNGLGYETLNAPGVPEVVRIAGGDLNEIIVIASKACLHIQSDASFAILSLLSPCDPPSHIHRPSVYPHGEDWSINEFNVSELAWRKIERRRVQNARVGMFRFIHRYQRPRFFLRWTGNTFEVPRAVGLYVLLKRRRRDLLRYNSQTREFSLPAICRPPLLLERALVLCSGLPPIYEPATARLTFLDVSRDIALLAAQLLRQKLS